jgi:CRP-like cAMP-binding protein
MNDEHPLVQRFRDFTALSEEDEARLRMLANNRPQMRASRRDLIREGERPQVVYLLLSGWAYRYKVLENGRRQLLQFLIPGDLCDVYNAVLSEMDHSIGALTEVRYAEISHEQIEQLERAGPHLRHALWWHSMTSIAMQREWTANIGQRSAVERLSHLFCELFLRLQAIGLTEGQSCEMPATQTDLGDATGLTSVHVNRTLQHLRESGLIILKNRTLIIPDLHALQKIALFSPNYLHLGNRGLSRPAGDDKISQAS